MFWNDCLGFDDNVVFISFIGHTKYLANCDWFEAFFI